MACGDIVTINGELYKDITPNMTSNTTPEPYRVISNSPYSYNSGVSWQAFDGQASYVSWKGSEVTINLYFGNSVNVDYMELWLANDQNGRYITVYGSNDNVNYTKICSARSYATGLAEIHPEQKVVLPKRVNYRYFRFSSEGTTVWFAIVEIRFYQKVQERFLLHDNTGYKTISNGNLQEAVKADIATVGFTDLQLIKGVANQIEEQFSLLRYNTENTNTAIQIEHLPEPQLIVLVEDIDLLAYSNIKIMTIKTTDSTGTVKLALSFDSGVTWQTYANGWQDIALTTDALMANGITPAALSAITQNQWAAVKTNTLRIAYCLRKTVVTDDIAVDSLTITGDTATWVLAGDDEYTYSYPDTKTMQVKLLADGSFKINYMNAK